MTFMIEYKINSDSSGQRMDRFLKKFFPKASKGFLEKMLRKKRIKLNGSRSVGSDMIKDGDLITFYFSEETFNTFKGTEQRPSSNHPIPAPLKQMLNNPVYENENFIVYNKPAGFRTQPDQSGKCSVAEAVLTVIPRSGTFTPAPVGRLDIGTSGTMIVPKNYAAQKKISAAVKKHETIKEYTALVYGKVAKAAVLKSRLRKDSSRNLVRVDSRGIEASLDYHPIEIKGSYSLLSVRLHTGRTHQIRVQLASAGYPIVGDGKYGDKKINSLFPSIRHPLLHCHRYAVPSMNLNVTGTPLPEDFTEVLKSLGFKRCH